MVNMLLLFGYIDPSLSDALLGQSTTMLNKRFGTTDSLHQQSRPKRCSSPSWPERASFGHDECGKHQVHLPLFDIVLRYGLTGSPTM
jgi:hypothetical protein